MLTIRRLVGLSLQPVALGSFCLGECLEGFVDFGTNLSSIVCLKETVMLVQAFATIFDSFDTCFDFFMDAVVDFEVPKNSFVFTNIKHAAITQQMA